MSDAEQIIRSINAASLIDVEQRCNDAKDQNEWTLWNTIYNYILAQKQQKIISQGGPTNAYFVYFRWCEWCGEIHINPKSV